MRVLQERLSSTPGARTQEMLIKSAHCKSCTLQTCATLLFHAPALLFLALSFILCQFCTLLDIVHNGHVVLLTHAVPQSSQELKLQIQGGLSHMQVANSVIQVHHICCVCEVKHLCAQVCICVRQKHGARPQICSSTGHIRLHHNGPER